MYIASCLERREECQELAKRLCALGHRVTSTWHRMSANTRGLDVEIRGNRTVQTAFVDDNACDIAECDTFVLLFDARGRSSLVEAGIAMGMAYFAGDQEAPAGPTRVPYVHAIGNHAEAPLMLCGADADAWWGVEWHETAEAFLAALAQP